MGMRRTFMNLAKQAASMQNIDPNKTTIQIRNPSFLKYYILVPILFIIAVILYLIPFITEDVPRPKAPVSEYDTADGDTVAAANKFITKFAADYHDKGKESVESRWLPDLPPFILDKSKKILEGIDNIAFIKIVRILVNPEFKDIVFVECHDVFKNKFSFRLLKKGKKSFRIIAVEPAINSN